jgi:eukaryotic-like serine/threonine-protein kinase
MSLEPGQVIGKYKVESTLGQGALAVTFKVVDAEGHPFALKVMYSRDESFRERLRRAGEAQSKVLHPNLVRVIETFETEGAPALLMEYVNGPDLEGWLKQGRPPLGQALKVFRGIVEGVDAAHQAGMVHRNLKPAKILLHIDDGAITPKINDFALVKLNEGAAKGGKALTQLGVSFGTPQYMAPEQFRDVSGVDHRADLFALGAILYELVTGVRAYDGGNLLAIYQKSAQGQYKHPRELVPDLPPSVATAIEKCLKVDPKLRPASCGELLQLVYGNGVLDAILSAPVEAAPHPPPPAPELRSSRLRRPRRPSPPRARSSHPALPRRRARSRTTPTSTRSRSRLRASRSSWSGSSWSC